MKTTTLPLSNHIVNNPNATSENIKTFYDEATEDYTFWSRDFNMHFGYCAMGRTNPLLRDTMLNEMNRQVMMRLDLDKGNQLIADLGCGMGGTMRYLMKQLPRLSTLGVTLSDFQVSEGNKLLKDTQGLILKENYLNTSIPNTAMDGVVAMESFCHTGHNNKTLQEAYRILKKGKRLVITDAFLKKDPSQLCLGSKFSYKGLCKGWSLDGLGVIDRVKENLEKIGFSKITIEDVSMHVAPSVFHVPFAIPFFIIKQFFKGAPIKKQSWNNLKASFYALVSGLHLKDFGYYIITAEK